jgi:MFS family permease
VQRFALVRFWSSDFLASFGDGLRLAGFPLLAAQITRSPTAVSAVIALVAFPWVLVGLGAGVFVDRHDLRWSMAWMQVLQIAMLIALATAVMMHAYDLLLLYGAAMLTGVASTVRVTAVQSATPRLVAPGDLNQMNGRLTAGEVVGSELLGPASAGWLFAAGPALPFALNAGGSGIAVLFVLTLPGVFRPLPRGPTAGVLDEMRAGLRWIATDRVIRDLVATVGVVAVADTAWFAVLVLYVGRILHEGPAEYGILLALGAVGGIAASSSYAWLSSKIGMHRLLIVAVLVMAATQLVLGLTSDMAVAAGMMVGSSAAFGTFNVTAVGLRQMRVPPKLLGRVNGAYLTVAGGAEAVGALLGGALASVAGIRAPMLAGVVPLLALAVALAWRGNRAETVLSN